MSATSVFYPRNDDTAQRLLWKIANLLHSGMGLAGSVAVGAGVSYDGNFWVFHAKTAATVSEITYGIGNGSGGTVPGDVVAAGDRIYGPITHLKLSSGTGELYKGSAL